MEAGSLDTKLRDPLGCCITSVDLHQLSEGWRKDPQRLCWAGNYHNKHREITQASRWRVVGRSPAESPYKAGKECDIHTGSHALGEEGVSGAVPRNDGAACTREQVALLFIVSTGTLNHDFGQVSYCLVK